MSHDRREFLRLGLAGSAALMAGYANAGTDGPASHEGSATTQPVKGPVIISTWDHGLPANKKAWEVLQSGRSVLDAVEQGVGVVESDFTNRSVGLGGLPDRDGFTTLDACIQDHDSRAGSVAFVQQFEHPISIARAVMERTQHVMLVGEGAQQWALENGFEKKIVDLPEVKKAWEEWKKNNNYTPATNHDTIGMVAIDGNGRMAGSCTTSGLAWKIHGRVGDSPIIGAGLFVDGDVGAACATGTGELVIRVAGSHSVVELMRQGVEPEEACHRVIDRIIRKHPGFTGHQIGLLALRSDGAHGAWSVYKGFNYALRTADEDILKDAPFVKEWEKP